MKRFIHWLLGGPPIEGWSRWLVARSATLVAVLILVAFSAIVAAAPSRYEWEYCGGWSARFGGPCPSPLETLRSQLAVTPSSGPVGARAEVVATVTERFTRPPTTSPKGLALATPVLPPGAPPTPTLPPDATPVVFGPFRLIPAGWEGEVTSDVLDAPPAGTPTVDPAEVVASPMYRGVPRELLRDDLALTYSEAGSAGVVLQFRSPSNEHLSLEVVRLRQAYRPQNEFVTGGTRTAVVDGRYAIVQDTYPPGPVRGLPPGSESRPYRTVVTMGAGGVVVRVTGVGYDEASLIEIARVMVP